VIVKIKTADTTRNNTAVLADDPHMTVSSIPASTYYAFDAVIRHNADAVPDIQFALSLPTNGEAHWDAVWQTPGTGLTDENPTAVAGAGADRIMFMRGYVMSGDGGTVAIQWAQNGAHANNTTMREGSWMKLTKAN
jgi:hypothetical protein